MNDAETPAETQLREIADALEAIRFRLLGVQASLPASSLEHDPLREEDEMDTATEIRAVVGCVLEDRIEPALQELRTVGAKTREE